MAGGADIEREPSPLSAIAKILCLDRRNHANEAEDDRHDQRSHSNLLDGIKDTDTFLDVLTDPGFAAGFASINSMSYAGGVLTEALGFFFGT
jgi:hypothetical protein